MKFSPPLLLSSVSHSIAWEGRIMVIGFAGGEVPKIPANILLVKNVSAIGFYWGQHALKDNAAYRKSVEDVFKLCDQGKISPHIGKVWTLDQVKYNWTSFNSFITFLFSKF